MKPTQRLRLVAKAPSLRMMLTFSMLCFSREGASCELDDSHSFRIDANSLSETLLLIGRTSGCTVAFKPDNTRDYRSQPIQGLLSVRQAMLQALLGSGLEMLQTRNGSLTVRRHNAARPSLAEE